MIKKIEGTRSYILVTFNDKVIKIDGELTLTPAFYADQTTIRVNETDEIIPDFEKENIINQILQYNNPEFQINFD